ncbi:unnamed protein product [Jaminaea pallidilutea]
MLFHNLLGSVLFLELLRMASSRSPPPPRSSRHSPSRDGDGRKSSRGDYGYGPSSSSLSSRRYERDRSYEGSRSSRGEDRYRSQRSESRRENERFTSDGRASNSNGSRRGYDEGRRERDADRYSEDRHGKYSSRGASRAHDDEDRYRPRRRSRSPDFERQRQREREAYGASAGFEPEVSTSADAAGAEDDKADEEPDFKPSGLLAKESNQVNGTALKYHEPPEAKRPKKKWRLYVFKNGEEIDLLHVSQQSCYLFGRDRAVVDVPLDHSSCSKQHAVLQYRMTVEKNEYGDEKRNIKPFLLDLESANGTTVNQKEVPASRYYELRNGDTVRFAASEREWVLLCEDV